MIAAPLVLLVAYGVQIATPLRMTVDSVGYLTMADSIASGHGVPPGSAFPIGLPGLYALLAVIGLGRSWALAGLNVVFVTVAVGCTFVLYRRVFRLGQRASLVLVCGVLLSYVLVKHAALALSDVPFLGVSYAALVALTLAVHDRSRRRFLALAVGIVLVGCAIAIRSAGVALGPAVLLAVVETVRGEVPLRRWWRTPGAAVTCLGCVAGVALVGYVLSSSRYFKQAAFTYGQQSFGSLLVGHIRDWGQVAVNAPEARLPVDLRPLVVPAGIAVVGVLLVGLWHERRRFEPVHVFAVSYLVLILVWPYTDPRFWLPLIPLTFGYGYVVLKPLLTRRVGAVLVGVYALVFAVIGVVALGYDTRVTYSGSSFPERYGSAETTAGTLQPTYRVAFGEARPGDGPQVNPAALAILSKWDPRARVLP